MYQFNKVQRALTSARYNCYIAVEILHHSSRKPGVFVCTDVFLESEW